MHSSHSRTNPLTPDPWSTLKSSQERVGPLQFNLVEPSPSALCGLLAPNLFKEASRENDFEQARNSLHFYSRENNCFLGASQFASPLVDSQASCTAIQQNRLKHPPHLKRIHRPNSEATNSNAALKSQITIARAWRAHQKKQQLKGLALSGFFLADLYISKTEIAQALGRPARGARVEVFGEFGSSGPWQEFITCHGESECFKGTAKIRLGAQFKFRINRGEAYSVSAHYSRIVTDSGFENNVFGSMVRIDSSKGGLSSLKNTAKKPLRSTPFNLVSPPKPQEVDSISYEETNSESNPSEAGVPSIAAGVESPPFSLPSHADVSKESEQATSFFSKLELSPLKATSMVVQKPRELAVSFPASRLRSSFGRDCLTPDLKEKQKGISLVSAGYSLAKKETGLCEDAFFVSSRGFGVSDGVSGWRKYGFSSADFSSELMNWAQIYMDNSFNSTDEDGLGSDEDEEQIFPLREFLRVLAAPKITGPKSAPVVVATSQQRAQLLTTGEGCVHMESQKLLARPTEGTQEARTSNQALRSQQPATVSSVEFEASQSTDFVNHIFNSCQNPVAILDSAFSKVKAFGSATALVAVKAGPSRIRIVNLGDSGFMHIRFFQVEEVEQASCVSRSKEQMHNFRTPYQLSRLPPLKGLRGILKQKGFIHYKELAKELKASMKEDQVSSGQEYNIEARPADVIISGSDGLFDNLFTHEILQIVEQFKASESTLSTAQQAQRLSHQLVVAARAKFSGQAESSSPFERRYRKEHLGWWKGGKADDVTAVVSFCV